MTALDLADSRSVFESAHHSWAREELRRFLRDCRSRLMPGDVGLPLYGIRRVRGLRREEVAELAGVSVTWYTRLELGTAERVSQRFATTIADALRLNETEQSFLFALLGAPHECASVERRGALDLIVSGGDTHATAALDGGLMMLSHNETFRRMFGIDDSDGRERRSVVECIFDGRVRHVVEDWDALAGFACGALRMQIARGHAGARATFERISADRTFTAHWQRRTLYDPQDTRLPLVLDHPMMGRVSVRLHGIGLNRSSNILLVASGVDDEACERMRQGRLHR